MAVRVVPTSVVIDLPEQMLGATVDGRYTLKALVGRGGFGAVFRAEDREGGPCAVKLIPFARASERAQAQREAARLEAHAHPGLVAFHRAGRFGPTAQGFVYIAMELGDGSLDEHLRRKGKLPTGEIARMVIDLLDALDHLHARGLVHGDVKAANLVRAGGRWKLCDLGSARAVADREAARDGTPEVTAPEAFEGAASAAADLWAVGLLVHACATGKLEPRVDPSLPAPLAAIVRGCLERDPARRFTSADVRSALAGAPLDEAPSSRGWRALAIATVVLAGLSTLAMLAWAHAL